MNQERASKKQQQLLGFVDGFIKSNGYGPSYREIMSALGYKSVSTVAIHIENLIAKGYIVRRDKSARSLEVVSLQSVSERPASKQGVIDLASELKARITAADLTDEQAGVVKQAIEILGIDGIDLRTGSETSDA